MSGGDSNSSRTPSDPVVPRHGSRISEQAIARLSVMFGAALCASSLMAAAYLFVYFNRREVSGPYDIFGYGIAAFVILCALFIGARMVIAGASTQRETIPAHDRDLLEPLISSGDEKAIDQYVRLSSLSGATGVATKLGLTGLPLLTVALTLIFAGLELYRPGAGFMDLTKLTLGAFIGSFVQRVATSQAAASAGRLPSPETLT